MKNLILLSVLFLLSAFMLISCNHSINTDNQSDNKTIPQGYVDLGLPSGTLWKAVNESDEDGFFSYDEAVSQFGSQLPTKEQWEELKDCCEWTWSESQEGCKVIGQNGKSVFLPAAGNRYCSGSVRGVGFGGSYWSSTPKDSETAWGLYFGSGSEDMDISCSVNMGYSIRCGGISVRLVQNK